ncbi:hypothetical protein [Halolamina salifodinae]|uniref:Uncharacterized protein n=1 Tax=Halolamina salifodinae TaxID=1202767 RepID=A0A8T4H027_9EURY|nr:hypothetical protein [Halolamina salifodinae]MBP1987723.1 hypothetical protein [Halolamina salifodinae]
MGLDPNNPHDPLGKRAPRERQQPTDPHSPEFQRDLRYASDLVLQAAERQATDLEVIREIRREQQSREPIPLEDHELGEDPLDPLDTLGDDTIDALSDDALDLIEDLPPLEEEVVTDDIPVGSGSTGGSGSSDDDGHDSYVEGYEEGYVDDYEEGYEE